MQCEYKENKCHMDNNDSIDINKIQISCGRPAPGPLQRFQLTQRAVAGVETEVEDAESALFASTDEGVKVSLPANVQGHVSGGAAHLELHVMAADFGRFR